jgi:hypothetical protein
MSPVVLVTQLRYDNTKRKTDMIFAASSSLPIFLAELVTHCKVRD